MVNVDFPGIKLIKVISNEPLFKCNRNKCILTGAAKWPYPPSSFDMTTYRNRDSRVEFLVEICEVDVDEFMVGNEVDSNK